jgi:hypothetical protein
MNERYPPITGLGYPNPGLNGREIGFVVNSHNFKSELDYFLSSLLELRQRKRHDE